ncbi:hypothetical protein EH372_12495 [Enterococcus faecium]|nr:hypothetical protein [Enterococcus faecium]
MNNKNTKNTNTNHEKRNLPDKLFKKKKNGKISFLKLIGWAILALFIIALNSDDKSSKQEASNTETSTSTSSSLSEKTKKREEEYQKQLKESKEKEKATKASESKEAETKASEEAAKKAKEAEEAKKKAEEATPEGKVKKFIKKNELKDARYKIEGNSLALEFNIGEQWSAESTAFGATGVMGTYPDYLESLSKIGFDEIALIGLTTFVKPTGQEYSNVAVSVDFSKATLDSIKWDNFNGYDNLYHVSNNYYINPSLTRDVTDTKKLAKLDSYSSTKMEGSSDLFINYYLGLPEE